MAIVSVLLAVSTHNHWLGLVLSVIGFPALLRAAAMGRFARNQQAKWGWNERLVSVLESLLIMWLIMIVGAVAVITVGFLISIALTVAQVPQHLTVPIALVVAAIGTVMLIVHLIRRSWPKAKS